jgi:hypothetical protein
MSFNDGFNIKSVPAPTTVKDAIDRLAAQLFIISGSIP